MGDNDAYEPWLVGVICLARVLLSALGCFGTILTFHTFLRKVRSDTVNLSLTWLAASDLLYLASVFVHSTALIFKSAEELTGYGLWFPVEPEAVYTVFTNIGAGSYAITMLVTTFITGLRCLCVVRPLHFRNLLSWKTTAVVLSLFTILSALTVILLLAYLGVTPQIDPHVNRTRHALWFSPSRKVIKEIIFALRDAVLPFVSQILVTICVIVMASSLQRSSKFRERHAMTMYAINKLQNSGSSRRIHQRSPSSVTNELTVASSRGKFGGIDQGLVSATTQLGRADETRVKPVGKEPQAVRQMLVIASFYAVCNSPKVAANLAELTVPGFSLGQSHRSVYNTVHGMRELFQTINAAAGFPIYMRYNSMFRRRCVIPSFCRRVLSPGFSSEDPKTVSSFR